MGAATAAGAGAARQTSVVGGLRVPGRRSGRLCPTPTPPPTPHCLPRTPANTYQGAPKPVVAEPKPVAAAAPAAAPPAASAVVPSAKPCHNITADQVWGRGWGRRGVGRRGRGGAGRGGRRPGGRRRACEGRGEPALLQLARTAVHAHRPTTPPSFPQVADLFDVWNAALKTGDVRGGWVGRVADVRGGSLGAARACLCAQSGSADRAARRPSRSPAEPRAHSAHGGCHTPVTPLKPHGRRAARRLTH